MAHHELKTYVLTCDRCRNSITYESLGKRPLRDFVPPWHYAWVPNAKGYGRYEELCPACARGLEEAGG